VLHHVLLLGVGDLEVLYLAFFTQVFFLLGIELGEKLCKFVTFLREIGLEACRAVFSSLLGLLKRDDCLFLGTEGRLILGLLLHQVLNSVVLGELQAGAEFYSLVQLGYLRLEFTDNLAGLLFLFLGGFDESPGFVDFFFQEANS